MAAKGRKTKRQASNNKKLNNLPDDLVFEILLKLPVRSLLLFKSVSKHWLNLIQNPNFIILHNNRPDHLTHDPMLFLQTLRNRKIVLNLLVSNDETLTYNDDVLSDVVTPSMAARVWAYGTKEKMVGEEDKLRLLGPCNGLFLVTDMVDALVVNPATRRCREITTPPGCVGFSAYFYCFGFGFDPVSNDYKVVRFEENQPKLVKNGNHYYYDDDVNDDDYYDDDEVVWYNDVDEQEPNDSFDDKEDDDVVDNNDVLDDNIEHFHFEINVYSLSTNCWKKLDHVISSYTSRIHSFSLFFNGALHWVAGDYHSICSVLVFDLNKEEFKRFELPNRCYEMGLCLNLSVLKESLALIIRRGCEYMSPGVDFAIWAMRRYGVNGSWRKLYNISPDVGIKRPLSFSKKGKLFFENRYGQLVSYNLQTREIKKLKVKGYRGSLHAFPCRESLVSLG